jgi:hypothetical protein
MIMGSGFRIVRDRFDPMAAIAWYRWTPSARYPFGNCPAGSAVLNPNNRRRLPMNEREVGSGGRVDFARINAAALARWLPDGRREGSEWVARNPRRADRKAGSFKINIETGKWADFATDEAGGDPVSLAAYLNRCSQADAARRLASMLGVSIDGR